MTVKALTPQGEEEMLELFLEGLTYKEVADRMGISTSTLYRLVSISPILKQRVMQAREFGFDLDADKLKTFADTMDDVNKARLKSDNYKWLLSRRAPHRFGDRLDLSISTPVDMASLVLEAKKRRDAIYVESEVDDAESNKELAAPKSVDDLI